jgi:hypothetical protein
MAPLQKPGRATQPFALLPERVTGRVDCLLDLYEPVVFGATRLNRRYRIMTACNWRLAARA